MFMFQIFIGSSGQLLEPGFELHAVPKTNLFVGVRLGGKQSAPDCTCDVSITSTLGMDHYFFGWGHE